MSRRLSKGRKDRLLCRPRTSTRFRSTGRIPRNLRRFPGCRCGVQPSGWFRRRIRAFWTADQRDMAARLQQCAAHKWLGLPCCYSRRAMPQASRLSDAVPDQYPVVTGRTVNAASITCGATAPGTEDEKRLCVIGFTPQAAIHTIAFKVETTFVASGSTDLCRLPIRSPGCDRRPQYRKRLRFSEHCVSCLRHR